MLQPNKDIANLQSNSTSPITSTWRASSPAFQNQSIPDIINIEDDEIPPYCPGPSRRKSSATPTVETSSITSMKNISANERPSNVSSSKHPPRKIGNSLPDDGYRSKHCITLLCTVLTVILQLPKTSSKIVMCARNLMYSFFCYCHDV